MSYHQNISELVSTSVSNKATVIGFDYPNVGSSTMVRENVVRFALYLLGWNMNAADAYKKIPDAHKMIIVSKHDSVIDYRMASLYQAVKHDLKQKYADDLQAYKAITHTFKISNGDKLRFVHGESLDSLLDKDSEQIVNTINKFVANKTYFHRD